MFTVKVNNDARSRHYALEDAAEAAVNMTVKAGDSVTITRPYDDTPYGHPLKYQVVPPGKVKSVQWKGPKSMEQLFVL